MTDLETLGPPPRHVPLMTTLTLICAGPLGIIGWVFTGIGLLFSQIALSPTAIALSLALMVDQEFVDGTVTAIERTSVSVNEAPVMEVHAMVDDQEVISYHTQVPFEVGAHVPVARVPAWPEAARIDGLWASPVPILGGLVVLIFPLVGIAMVSHQVRKGLRWRRMLERGIETRGTRIAKAPTGTRINNEPVMKLTFRFEDGYGGERLAHAKGVDTSRMEDEPTERILYDPHDQGMAVVVDEMPAWMGLGPRRTWDAPTTGIAFKALALPAGVLTVNLLVFAARMVT